MIGIIGHINNSILTLGLESLDTPTKFIQKRRTLFCFCSRLDNNQGGVNTFIPKCKCCVDSLGKLKSTILKSAKYVIYYIRRFSSYKT